MSAASIKGLGSAVESIKGHGGLVALLGAILMTWNDSVGRQAETQAQLSALKERVALVQEQQVELDRWVKRYVIEGQRGLLSAPSAPSADQKEARRSGLASGD